MKRKTLLRLVLVGILMFLLLVVAAAVERSRQQGGLRRDSGAGVTSSR